MEMHADHFFCILNTNGVAMPVSANNQQIDFLKLLAIDSLTLSMLSSVLSNYGLLLFSLCKTPIDVSFLNLQTIIATIFISGGFAS